jgi:hypothetical protein
MKLECEVFYQDLRYFLERHEFFLDFFFTPVRVFFAEGLPAKDV